MAEADTPVELVEDSESAGLNEALVIVQTLAEVLRDSIRIFESDKRIQKELFALFERTLDARNMIRYGHK